MLAPRGTLESTHAESIRYRRPKRGVQILSSAAAELDEPFARSGCVVES
jgi:hypothetical protein